MKSILTTLILMIALAGITPAAFAGDKVYACHITSYNIDTDRWEGHAISISTKALGAHCSHNGVPDHRPIGVINAAISACAGEDGKALAKCMDHNVIGADCSRDAESENPVALLCDD